MRGTQLRILAHLKSGFVRCVISTNALEAGVDIPELDAVLLLGHTYTHALALVRLC
jgi:ATP-dependent helicase YprA (DUF1998 family)